MSVGRALLTAAVCVGALVCGGCGQALPPRCGPAQASVARVIDGDTIELADGQRVRYLLVDAPESADPSECFGAEAKTFNEAAVTSAVVQLRYDTECRDRFGRLLAYVRVAERELNTVLVERGLACVLHIPPNGNERVAAMRELEASAKAAGAGLWGACAASPC